MARPKKDETTATKGAAAGSLAPEGEKVRPAETGPEYTLMRSEEGRLDLILRECDQTPILQDENKPDYQAFKQWANQQEKPVDVRKYVFPPGHNLIKTRDAFVEHCKKHGFRLFAIRNNLFSKYTVIRAGEVSDNYGLGRMVRLAEPSVPAPGISGDTLFMDGVSPKPSNVWVSEALDIELANELSRDDHGDIRKLSTIPLERTFVYIDVSDYSKLEPGQQVLVVNSIINILGWTPYWDVPECPEARMCIGDGFIFVFKNPYHATLFACNLARLIDVSVAKQYVPIELHFRMGIHVEPVYFFWDEGRSGWNYIGRGINGGNRVVSAIGKDVDDVLFISDKVRREIISRNDGSTQCRVLIANMANRGRKADKHSNLWRVFEINYTSVVYLHPDFGQ
jgi:hypothetical protein